MNSKSYYLVTFFLVLSLAYSCGHLSVEDEKKLLEDAQNNFKPLPTSIIDQTKFKAKIELGQKLYHENKLSPNKTISCNSCHKLDNFGVDNQPTSLGDSGKRGERNSPTVYNAALHFAQFWDGRAENVEAQALGPLLNPIEHGIPNEKAAMKILKDAGYEPLFAEAFKGEKKPFTLKNVGNAIGAFEKTLLTPSRFDQYLSGKTNALSLEEKKGLKKFIEVGCTSCHNGVAIGGDMFQKLGLEFAYNTKDKGRFNITKDPEDMHVFKVPGLRNIARTYPYFHDGSLQTLEEVIPVMAKHQLGVTLKGEEIKTIRAFLESLTWEKEQR